MRPQNIVAAVKKFSFEAEGNQDAYEFLVKMIHQMKCGALWEAGIDPDTFNWSDYNRNSYDHFHDLLLEISHKNCTSLLTVFQHYTEAETLGYDNQCTIDFVHLLKAVLQGERSNHEGLQGYSNPRSV